MSVAVDTRVSSAAVDGATHNAASPSHPTSACQCNTAWLPDSKIQLPSPADLTAAQVTIVKATAPVLKEHGVTITSLFYKNMIDAHPELRDVFSVTSQATGAQPRALASAVLGYATYIDDLPKLGHAVSRIAHKHVSLHIRPEHYGIVGHHLIEAIGLVLGDAATPDIVDAWTTAYAVLAGVFIGLEGQMYGEHADWVGFRKFRVARKVPESETITSFYLAPQDERPLPRFLPGQYVSLQLLVPGLGHLQSRQYSLSEAPRKEGDYYRVSIKREEGVDAGIAGIVSNMLHDSVAEGDEVEVSHPQGEFFFDPADASKADAPLVLISAGVGATPLMSILESATTQAASLSPRPVSWIHASRSSAQRPFASRVAEIQAAHPELVSTKLHLNQVGPDDVEGRDYHTAGGRLSFDSLDGQRDLLVGDDRAEYYVCGPEAWMLDVRERLAGLGVAQDRIHLELFATGDVQ